MSAAAIATASTAPRAATVSRRPRGGTAQLASAPVDAVRAEELFAQVVARRMPKAVAEAVKPLREELTSARRAFERQTMMRAEAESRAAEAQWRVTEAQQEAARLRVRVSELEGELAACEQAGPFRRRTRQRAEQLG